jgi:hypothetical protein
MVLAYKPDLVLTACWHVTSQLALAALCFAFCGINILLRKVTDMVIFTFGCCILLHIYPTGSL